MIGQFRGPYPSVRPAVFFAARQINLRDRDIIYLINLVFSVRTVVLLGRPGRTAFLSRFTEQNSLT